MENNTEQAPAPVFPSEAEALSAIIDNYKSQIEENITKTEEALKKLKTNLDIAKKNNIALIAQKKLIDVLGQNVEELIQNKKK